MAEIHKMTTGDGVEVWMNYSPDTLIVSTIESIIPDGKTVRIEVRASDAVVLDTADIVGDLIVLPGDQSVVEIEDDSGFFELESAITFRFEAF